ncbi:MAG: hypothetical protein HY736_07715 [Verrucomicrobia bacterium]|nr:hypothetical protein [Verrucomicrobiota bacterium]
MNRRQSDSGQWGAVTRLLRFVFHCSLFTVYCLLIPGCAKRETAVEAGIRTQTLVLGNFAEPTDLDPAVASTLADNEILLALFEGLTRIDEKTSQPAPAAAERWGVSPDGLICTFHLRPNLRWSNGDSFGATDFVFSFERMLTPAVGAEYSYMLWPIKAPATGSVR